MFQKSIMFTIKLLKNSLLVKKVAELLSWVEKRLNSKYKKMISKALTPKQKSMIKRLLSPSKRHIINRFEKSKIRLYSIGFIQKEIRELEKLSEDTSPLIRNLALWNLVLWHANQCTTNDAKKCLEYISKLNVKKGSIAAYEIAILEAECLKNLGDLSKAKSVIESINKKDFDDELFLCMSNLEIDECMRIYYMNELLKRNGLSEVSLINSNNDQPYHCLGNKGKGNELLNDNTNERPKVTVIVPIHNDEDIIQTTIESILAQTWSNLEVIVVNDSSTDNTSKVLKEKYVNDPRVLLINLDSLEGPFCARNAGLKASTGDFVTVTTANEWSHPEKIEKQVVHLLRNPEVIGNTTQFIWVDEKLEFYRQKNNSKFIEQNLTSFLFRREKVLETVGFWDSVLYGADIEYIDRIKKAFGNSSVVALSKTPVTFKKTINGHLNEFEISLSNRLMFGALKEYFESYTHYIQNVKSLYYEYPQRMRKYPVPQSMLQPKINMEQNREHYDIILASDFRLVGGSTMSNIEEIKAQKAHGLKTGLVQMARYDVDPSKTVNDKVREEIDGELVQMLAYGENVSCDLLIFRYPPVLHEWQKYMPQIEAKEVKIIINQPPMSDYGPNAVLRYDLAQCQKNIRMYTGKEGIWYPIGPLVREALHQHHNSDLKVINLSEEDWSNIVNVAEWKRGNYTPGIPNVKIGRHSRDHEVKWPNDKKELLTIYPDSEKYEVCILGGGTTPLRVIGYKPRNWKVYEFGELSPKEFLASIDVFVYYTHPKWVESFGRVIIEAMATGVPVILPYIYKDLFEEAAIYADPENVLKVVDKLISDKDYYNFQVKKAYDYVEKRFGYSMHYSRVRVSLKKDTSTV